MRDCENVEIRDLLPDYAHGALAGAERARVEAHLSECDGCRSELALLRAVRTAHVLPEAPGPDVARIVAALPRAGMHSTRESAASSRPGVISLDAHRTRRSAARRSLPWRQVAAAAAVVVAAIGIGIGRRNVPETVVVPGTRDVHATAPSPSATALANTQSTATATVSSIDTPHLARHASPTGSTRRTTDALGALGGIASDATDAELEALIGELESLSGIPEVESAEVEGALGHGGQG